MQNSAEGSPIGGIGLLILLLCLLDTARGDTE